MSKDTDRKKQSQLPRNAFFSGLSSLSDVFLLLLLIYAGRSLGPDSYGDFSYALAITTILVFLLNLGIDSLVIRKIAISREFSTTTAATIISYTFTWKLILCLIITIAFILFAILTVHDEVNLNLLLVLAPAATLRSVNMTLRSYIQGFEYFHLESIVVISERFLLFLVGVSALSLFGDVILLAWSFLIVRIVSVLSYVYIIDKHICHFKLSFNFKYIKQFQFEAFPLGVAALVFGVYTQIDIIMLGLMGTALDVGLFSAPQKLYEGCFVIALVVTSVVYPRLSAIFESNIKKYHDLFALAFKYLFILGTAIAFIGVLFSKNIVIIFFGEKFQLADVTLSVLLVGIGLYFLVLAIYMLFRSMGKQKLVMYLSFVGLVLKVIFNLVLIPRYGDEGAALSVLMSTFLIFAIASIVARKCGVNVFANFSILARILVAGGVGAFVVMLYEYSLAVSIITFMSVYLVSLFALRCFERHELNLMREIVPFFKKV